MRKRTLKTRIRLWLARRSSRRRLTHIIGILLFIILCPTLLFAALHVPLLSVRAVNIIDESGVVGVMQDELHEYTENLLDGYWYFIPNKMRFFFQKKDIETALRERFLYLADVQIETRFFNMWDITVTKKKTFGTYCANEQCLHIDVDGFIFGRSDAIQAGRVFVLSGDVAVGEFLLPPTEDDDTDFSKLHDIIAFLEDNGIEIESIAVRKEVYDIHIQTNNDFGIWIDLSERQYDIIQALHATLVEIFPNQEDRKNLSSVIVCDPLQVHWTTGKPWQSGCREGIDLIQP